MSEVLKNKIDFVVLVSVNMANCNGDPLNGNRPRTDYNGYGEISDVCIKRKIRNRMQDMGANIFVQSENRCDDGFCCLRERAEEYLGKADKKTNREEYAKKACEYWLDVRSCGQLFAFNSKKGREDDEGGVSVGVRGPVSIHQAVSASPIEVHTIKITKSVNGNPSEARGSDTMGDKHMVRFGLYKIKGSINVQLAEKTGFTEDDAQMLKECLRTLFENDASSARPDGSMRVLTLFWWEHNCKNGQYSSARIHDSVKIVQLDEEKMPSCVNDYDIVVEPLDGISPEVICGF